MKQLLTKNFFDNPFDFFFTPSYLTESSAMKTDIIEKETEYQLAIELAGFKKEEISLNLEKEILTVSASTQETSSTEKYLRRERSVSCKRTYRIGHVKKESIKASFVDGILYVSIPKEQETIDTKISIS